MFHFISFLNFISPYSFAPDFKEYWNYYVDKETCSTQEHNSAILRIRLIFKKIIILLPAPDKVHHILLDFLEYSKNQT